MRSRVFDVLIHHRRSEAREHAFTYRAFYLLLDVDELPTITRHSRTYGHEVRRLFSTHGAHLLDRRAGDLRTRVAAYAPEARDHAHRVLVLLAPRVLGMGFDPIRMYYVLDAREHLVAAVAEVENTYGDVHLYPLHPRLSGEGRYEADHDKEMFVSPFFGVDGCYRFRMQVPNGSLALTVDLVRNGRVVLHASMHGKGAPFSDAALLRAFARAPLSPALAMPRIVAQALRLRFGKKLRPRMRPRPATPRTVVTQVALRHRFGMFDALR